MIDQMWANRPYMEYLDYCSGKGGVLQFLRICKVPPTNNNPG